MILPPEHAPNLDVALIGALGFIDPGNGVRKQLISLSLLAQRNERLRPERCLKNSKTMLLLRFGQVGEAPGPIVVIPCEQRSHGLIFREHAPQHAGICQR